MFVHLSPSQHFSSSSENGEPCFYVFNVSDYGFVMVSATDLVRPILGYSEDGIFETDNIAPSFGFMMENYKEAITSSFDWESLVCHKCTRTQQCSKTKNPKILLAIMNILLHS